MRVALFRLAWRCQNAPTRQNGSFLILNPLPVRSKGKRALTAGKRPRFLGVSQRPCPLPARATQAEVGITDEIRTSRPASLPNPTCDVEKKQPAPHQALHFHSRDAAHRSWRSVPTQAQIMPSPLPTFRKLYLLLVAHALFVVGCAGLPRIDPTGERLFVFPQQSPTVTTPGIGAVQAPPVRTDPVFPSPALQPGVVPGTLPGIPVAEDKLSITPDRILAPVGTEVILRAGICAREGFLLTDQKIEWLVARDSAGEIVDLGGRGCCRNPILPWNKPEKIDNQYGIGYTARWPLQITRGTANPADDVASGTGPCLGEHHVACGRHQQCHRCCTLGGQLVGPSRDGHDLLDRCSMGLPGDDRHRRWTSDSHDHRHAVERSHARTGLDSSLRGCWRRQPLGWTVGAGRRSGHRCPRQGEHRRHTYRQWWRDHSNQLPTGSPCGLSLCQLPSARNRQGRDHDQLDRPINALSARPGPSRLATNPRFSLHRGIPHRRANPFNHNRPSANRAANPHSTCRCMPINNKSKSAARHVSK